MSAYRIAWLPGDGIGIEVLEAARIVLDAVGFEADYRHGESRPEQGLWYT